MFSQRWDLSERAVIWAHTRHFVFDALRVAGTLRSAAGKRSARIRGLPSAFYFHRGFLLLLSLSSSPLAFSQLNTPAAAAQGGSPRPSDRPLCACGPYQGKGYGLYEIIIKNPQFYSKPLEGEELLSALKQTEQRKRGDRVHPRRHAVQRPCEVSAK